MLAVFLSCVVGVAFSQFQNIQGVTGWDQLKTTFGTNPFSAYYPVPLTESAAHLAPILDGHEKSSTWTQVMSCESNGVGNVYIEDDDISVMPIYGVNGQVFGIILAFYEPGESARNSSDLFTKYTLMDGTVVYGVTAYFREPSTVCTEERKYNSSDVGDRLYIKGASPSDNGGYLHVPQFEDADGVDELELHGFKEGACFWGMGKHYWRYMDVDMDCNDTYPLFVLYNGGKLQAWGIAMAHDDRPTSKVVKKYSKKWEYPKGNSLNFFFKKGQTPTCLPLQGELITMHVYMNNPAYMLCI